MIFGKCSIGGHSGSLFLGQSFRGGQGLWSLENALEVASRDLGLWSLDGVLEVVRRVHPVQCHEQHYLRRHSLPLAKMCALSWVDNRSGMMIIEGVAQLTTWHLPREVLDLDTGVLLTTPKSLPI